MKLVVGLGNPGPDYERTRHNVGFEAVAEVARRYGGSFQKSKFEAVTADVRIGDQRVLLALPQTYMNRSGRSVTRVVDFYRVTTEHMTVVCDDMNLELGRLRYRGAGSAGGQKGVADIIAALGTDEFPRLRIGIGRPPGRMDASRFVLGRFNRQENEVMELAVQQAADAIEVWVRDGLASAMNRFNSGSTEP